MEEKELIALLKKEDGSAMKILFTTYHARLCLLAYRLVKDEDQAKDIVQEVFIRLWKNRHNLQIRVTLEAYLRRAVVNTALNLLESGARQRKLEQTDLGNWTEVSADEALMAEELTLKANHAVNTLPPRTRTVFVLIRVEEMSYKEVAETLDISLKAVEKEMMKALKLLREALREYLPLLILFVNPFLV